MKCDDYMYHVHIIYLVVDHTCYPAVIVDWMLWYKLHNDCHFGIRSYRPSHSLKLEYTLITIYHELKTRKLIIIKMQILKYDYLSILQHHHIYHTYVLTNQSPLTLLLQLSRTGLKHLFLFLVWLKHLNPGGGTLRFLTSLFSEFVGFTQCLRNFFELHRTFGPIGKHIS